MENKKHTLLRMGGVVLFFVLIAWGWMQFVGTSVPKLYHGFVAQVADTSPAEIGDDAQTLVYELERAVVRFVVDGDTFVLSDGRTVRLIGVDTPERWQGGYAEAKAFLFDLIFKQEVALVRDVRDIDKYGRLLRYVYLDDVFVNLELVERGYARVLTVPPDVAHESEFSSAQDRAEILES